MVCVISMKLDGTITIKIMVSLPWMQTTDLLFNLMFSPDQHQTTHLLRTLTKYCNYELRLIAKGKLQIWVITQKLFRYSSLKSADEIIGHERCKDVSIAVGWMFVLVSNSIRLISFERKYLCFVTFMFAFLLQLEYAFATP